MKCFYFNSGHDAPRHTRFTQPLPSTREVSNLLFQNNDKAPNLDPKINVLHMSFGQFLDHDLIFTPMINGKNFTRSFFFLLLSFSLSFSPSLIPSVTSLREFSFSSGNFSCCGRDEHKPPCIPITIPPNDPFFRQNCMPLKRSASILVKHGKTCKFEYVM